MISGLAVDCNNAASEPIMERTSAPINTCLRLAYPTHHACVSRRCTRSSPSVSTTGTYHGGERLLLNQIYWGTLCARISRLARSVGPSKGKKKHPTDIPSTANPFIYRSRLFRRPLSRQGASYTNATECNSYAESELGLVDNRNQTRS